MGLGWNYTTLGLFFRLVRFFIVFFTVYYVCEAMIEKIWRNTRYNLYTFLLEYACYFVIWGIERLEGYKRVNMTEEKFRKVIEAMVISIIMTTIFTLYIYRFYKRGKRIELAGLRLGNISIID